MHYGGEGKNKQANGKRRHSSNYAFLFSVFVIYKNYAPPSLHRRSRVLHHIICGGIEQRDIFHDDADRKNFVDRLGDVRIMKTNKANASFQT